MGNCQAVDAATLVIQYPCGRAENLYWPVTASEIMKTNPGHYVALLITTTTFRSAHPNNGSQNNDNRSNSVRFTRIKLLRPTDTLGLGHVYRLITAQEVMKCLWAKKCAKMKKNQPNSAENQETLQRPGARIETAARKSELENTNQVMKHEIHRQRTETSTNSAVVRSKTWQPSLKSISEAGS